MGSWHTASLCGWSSRIQRSILFRLLSSAMPPLPVLMVLLFLNAKHFPNRKGYNYQFSTYDLCSNCALINVVFKLFSKTLPILVLYIAYKGEMSRNKSKPLEMPTATTNTAAKHTGPRPTDVIFKEPFFALLYLATWLALEKIHFLTPSIDTTSVQRTHGTTHFRAGNKTPKVDLVHCGIVLIAEFGIHFVKCTEKQQFLTSISIIVGSCRIVMELLHSRDENWKSSRTRVIFRQLKDRL